MAKNYLTGSRVGGRWLSLDIIGNNEEVNLYFRLSDIKSWQDRPASREVDLVVSGSLPITLVAAEPHEDETTTDALANQLRWAMAEGRL